MTYNVVLAATCGRVSGVDVFSCNLVRGLVERGIPAHIVLTTPLWLPPDPLPLPPDIPSQILPTGHYASWSARWRALVRYLEERAPCIYIPNYDWDHSCISPRLSNRVVIAGIVHSDDPQHYEHVARLGRYWNAVVAVSSAIAGRVSAIDPTLASRLVTIPYGVTAAGRRPERQKDGNAPLKIVYAGRLVQEQKRVMDLPGIIRALADLGIPAELTVIGGGIEQDAMVKACDELGIREQVNFLGILPNEQVLQIFSRNDVFILTSAYEGLPVSLLEAMGQGCVPVVTDIKSGIPEVITNGENGYRLPVGDIPAFVQCLASLHRDPAFRKSLANQAQQTILNGKFNLDRMVERYVLLFEELLAETEKGAFCRSPGKVLPPPSLHRWGYLPAPVQWAGYHGRRLLTNISSRTDR